jgi:transcription elongation factor GreA
MAEEKHFISKEKLDDLHKELEHLKTVRRKEIAEHLEHARALGDISENAEYQEARDEQGKVEDRIAQIEHIIKHAEIVAPHHSDKAEVGSTVIIKKQGETATRTIMIVGPEEADTTVGHISYQSPLGQALLGKGKGEAFSFSTPTGEVKYVVVDVD